MRTARCACDFPSPAAELEAVIVNTGGGMAGGDRFDVRHRGRSRRAARRRPRLRRKRSIARSAPDADSRRAARRSAPARTSLGCRRRRSCSIGARLGARSTSISPRMPRLVFAEAIVFGRTGHGRERPRRARWRTAGASASAGGSSSPKTCGWTARSLRSCRSRRSLKVALRGGDCADRRLAMRRPSLRVRALANAFAREVGVSAWNGICRGAFVRGDGAALRHD